MLTHPIKYSSTGNLHPLMKVKKQFREVLLEMGFEEMGTNQFVESSFWNFDALFQPQQHPARDAHDTFFVRDPATSKNEDPEYWERVKKTHETGGYGSIGYRYNWSYDEAKKNIFRTHTTAVINISLCKLSNIFDNYRSLQRCLDYLRKTKSSSLENSSRSTECSETSLLMRHIWRNSIKLRELLQTEMLASVSCSL